MHLYMCFDLDSMWVDQHFVGLQGHAICNQIEEFADLSVLQENEGL